MAVPELGRLDDIERWDEAAPEHSLPLKVAGGLYTFGRKKPLGAFCGLIVLLAAIFGDLVPASANKITDLAGFGEPVPYLADQLVDQVGFIYPYDRQFMENRLEGSSSEFLLGTDAIGRDVLSRLLYGTRVAVVVAFGAVFISSVLAAVIGISTAYYGGWFDTFMFRIVDIFQALPGLVVLITFLGLFNQGMWPLTLVLGLLLGPIGSRVVRSQALSVMVSPYVEAARVVGASDRRIMIRYVLPNVFPLIILSATLLLGIFVLFEATVSFLGFGIEPPYPSWGQMLSLDGRNYMRSAPGLAIYPGVAIGILVFSFNLFGDALRDVLDPRLRGNR